MNALDEALRISRSGDVAGAIELLRASEPTQAHLSLLFQLVSAPEEAIEIASAALALAKLPMAKSTWALRRGLLHLEKGHRDQALNDLQQVLKLRASEEQQTQARQALLRVAALKR